MPSPGLRRQAPSYMQEGAFLGQDSVIVSKYSYRSYFGIRQKIMCINNMFQLSCVHCTHLVFVFLVCRHVCLYNTISYFDLVSCNLKFLNNDWP